MNALDSIRCIAALSFVLLFPGTGLAEQPLALIDYDAVEELVNEMIFSLDEYADLKEQMERSEKKSKEFTKTLPQAMRDGSFSVTNAHNNPMMSHHAVRRKVEAVGKDYLIRFLMDSKLGEKYYVILERDSLDNVLIANGPIDDITAQVRQMLIKKTK